jgi:hypothetical protein
MGRGMWIGGARSRGGVGGGLPLRAGREKQGMGQEGGAERPWAARSGQGEIVRGWSADGPRMVRPSRPADPAGLRRDPPHAARRPRPGGPAGAASPPQVRLRLAGRLTGLHPGLDSIPRGRRDPVAPRGKALAAGQNEERRSVAGRRLRDRETVGYRASGTVGHRLARPLLGGGLGYRLRSSARASPFMAEWPGIRCASRFVGNRSGWWRGWNCPRASRIPPQDPRTIRGPSADHPSAPPWGIPRRHDRESPSQICEPSPTPLACSLLCLRSGCFYPFFPSRTPGGCGSLSGGYLLPSLAVIPLPLNASRTAATPTMGPLARMQPAAKQASAVRPAGKRGLAMAARLRPAGQEELTMGPELAGVRPEAKGATRRPPVVAVAALPVAALPAARRWG